MPNLTHTNAKHIIDQLVSNVSSIILGKENTIRLAINCILANGHLLIEDLPGVGKTTLAHALAKSLGMDFSRIQFTSDLLPADILGVSVYEQSTNQFHFHKGPVFSNLVLADEINRATPKTQSALLEAMEEHQISMEGETRPLPEPFFVIATQNPTYQIGTFKLPESQLDRFLMKISLGYPDAHAEKQLLMGTDRRNLLSSLACTVNLEQLKQLQQAVTNIHTSDAVIEYIQHIIQQSRTSPNIAIGLSPRAGLAILHSAKAWALMNERDHVLPDDVQAILTSVIAHRLKPIDDDQASGTDLANQLLQTVVV
jgi:MoxR-like ATPase